MGQIYRIYRGPQARDFCWSLERSKASSSQPRRILGEAERRDAPEPDPATSPVRLSAWYGHKHRPESATPSRHASSPELSARLPQPPPAQSPTGRPPRHHRNQLVESSSKYAGAPDARCTSSGAHPFTSGGLTRQAPSPNFNSKIPIQNQNPKSGKPVDRMRGRGSARAVGGRELSGGGGVGCRGSLSRSARAGDEAMAG